MERFNLTRYDLMCMSWTEVIMLFDSTYDEPEDGKASAGRQTVREATEQDYENWA